MKRFYKRIYLFAGIAFVFALLLLFWILYWINHNGGIFAKKRDNSGRKIIVFAAPALRDSVFDIAKKYSNSKGVKISLNFVHERDLEQTVAESTESNQSIAFIGYRLNEEHEDISYRFGTGSIVGVTNNVIFDGVETSHKFSSLKNLCQLQKVLAEKDLHIFIADGFSPITETIKDIYSRDCEKVCDSVVNRVMSLTDVPSVEFVKSNPRDYILVGQDLVSEMLTDEDFIHQEAFGLQFYIYKSIAQPNNRPMTQYSLIEMINNHDIGIVSDHRFETDTIKQTILSACKNTIHANNINFSMIDIESFAKKDGVLIGLQTYISDVGVKVYESPVSIPIWMHCKEEKDETCSAFLTFLVGNLKKS